MLLDDYSEFLFNTCCTISLLQIHEHKYHFNLRLLKIRDKKLGVIEEIRELVAELREVQAGLDKEKHKAIPPIPKMYPEEMPEK